MVFQNDSFSTFLLELFDKFLPVREILNVVKMAFTSTSYHLNMLTTKHWYIIIFFILVCFTSTLFILVYFQNYHDYNILKHIKLRHNWVLYGTPECPKYCTNCSGIIKRRSILMKNYEGWQCLFCKRISHFHCIMQSDSQCCKIESSNNIASNISINKINYRNFSYSRSSFDNEKVTDFLHLHVLIKGNLQSGSLCSICRTLCFSPFGLTGQRCVWCNRTFHDECANEKNISNQECDLGALKYIILPPNSFFIELIRTNKNGDHIINKSDSIFDDDLKNNLYFRDLSFKKFKNTSETIKLKTETFKLSTKRRRISEFIQMIPKSISYQRKLRFCDDFLTNKYEKPLLVFVNTKSGGHFGQRLIKDLYFYLNPIQIVDIQTSKGPDEALKLFKELAIINRLLILVCGGDGTVRWVIDRCREIYGFDFEKLPPIAVLPLGTGNDLSRILGWDVTFDGDIFGFLKRICTSKIRRMDIWNCTAFEINNKKSKVNSKNLLFSSTFLNYLDIGIAARIALKFHNLREEYPQHFNSRLGNQLVYGEVGLKDFFLNKSIQLDGLRIWCDGEEVSILNNFVRAKTNSDNFNSSQLNKFEPSIIQKVSHFFLKNNAILLIFTYLKYIFLRLYGIKGFLELNTKIMSDDKEETEMRTNYAKNQKLEGLVICNIPSFAGGVNLWNVSTNYSKNKSKSFFKSKDTEETNKFVCKNVNERSMSFSICKAQNYDNLSCKNDPSDDDEITELDYKFSDDRIRSINTLKSWFSNSFMNSFPIISRQDHSSIHVESNNSSLKFERQKIDDGLIEVVGIRSLFHLTQLQVGLTEPVKLCQGRDITVEIPKQIPFQVDGEPKIINKCRLNINLLGKIPILCPEKIENTIPLSVKNALELAVQKNIVDNSQRNWITRQILKESRI
ncbi:hypothetical protein FG386_003192 [Cryptosporidium ryanae]|uniref:uncharacterized protein n=1 Tax=Cryptosporidium ryanae TaxID=515981 RepID=UPI00351A3DCA|nr:hypothetical protein FG386_003192 [Cryptosporidium ryanae]